MSHAPRQASLSSPLAFTLSLLPAHARLLALGLAGLLTLLLMWALPASLETLEERLGALGWTLHADTALEQRVSIVGIDEKSLEALGPWPWPRQTMARLAQSLHDAGVQLQLYDVVFPEAQPGDDALLQTLLATNAVVAQVPVLQSSQAIQTGVMTHPLQGLNCNNGSFHNTSNYLASHAGFTAVPKGHITPMVAGDGSVRQVPAVICHEGRAYPSLAISALLQAVGSEFWSASLTPGQGWLAPDGLLSLDDYPGLDIPLDAEGMMRLSYRSVPESFQMISAVDVIEGNVDRAMLDNTWVLVGYTAFGLVDIVPTPWSGAAPGVELQARMLVSLLDTSLPYTPASAVMLQSLLCLGFALVLFSLASARERLASLGLPLAALLLPLLALALHVQLLGKANLWLGWIAPAIYGLGAASLLILLEHGRVRLERSRVFGNLSSYLPSQVAAEIAYNLPSSAIDARRCEVTLLNADLRNFSAYGEARPPEESAALLHYFFVRAADIIERHGGRVHEFKGDGLLAVWDGQDARSAGQALRAAQAMQLAIQRDMPEQPPAGLEPLALGIGIEQGTALMGSIGPAHRRSLTLLGDTVTITFRIQEMTAELAQPILLGEKAASHLRDHGLESQGSYLLSGLRIPHTLYAPPLVERKADHPTLKVLPGGRL